MELASRGIPCLLTSSTEKIHAVKDEITDLYHTECHSFVVDLANEDEVLEWCGKIAARYNIYILVNNVGTGGSCALENATMDYLLRILHINILCTTILTKSLLSDLKRNAPAYIMNIGSMAGFTPTAYKTVYPASKAFVHAFTLGLREELRGTGVSVTLAAPGAMATNPEVCSRIKRQGLFGRATLKPTPEIARQYVNGMLRGKRTLILNPLGYILSKFIPERWRIILLSHIVKREL